jgi:hypothetical protein
VRDVQKFLLVIGATALGAASFGLGVSCFLAVLPAGCRGIAGVGAAGLAMMLFAAGTALGAIVGFAAAVVRIRRHKSEPWKPTVWCGAGLGVLIGLVFYALSRLVASPPAAGVWESWPVAWARGVIAKLPDPADDLFDMLAHWPIAAALLTAALGMLGGLLAKFAGSPWDRHGRPAGGPSNGG